MYIYVGFHDKTRLKSENKKMELAIPLDRVDVYLSLKLLSQIMHIYKPCDFSDIWIEECVGHGFAKFVV